MQLDRLNHSEKVNRTRKIKHKTQGYLNGAFMYTSDTKNVKEWKNVEKT